MTRFSRIRYETIGGGAGGAIEKIGEFDVTSAQATMPVTFTLPITRASVAEVRILAEFQLSLVSEIKMSFDGLAGVSLRSLGMAVLDDETFTGFDHQEVNLLGTGFVFALDNAGAQFMNVMFKMAVDGNVVGTIDESGNIGSPVARSRRGTWIGDSTASSITGVTVNTVSGLFSIGSSVRVYALKR